MLQMLCLLVYGLCATPPTKPTPFNNGNRFGEFVIDYSAANEFIKAHYGTLNGKPSYFERNSKVETVYNARQTDCTFQTHGFHLLHDRNFNSATLDWKDMASVRDLYFPYLENVIQSAFNESIQEVIFWCPSLRTGRRNTSNIDEPEPDHAKISIPPSGNVATAHIDTDVNAYESVEALVTMIVKNKVVGTSSRSSVQSLVDAIERQGRRFAIVNAWRNIDEHPVANAPLAFMPSRYKEANDGFPPRGSFDEDSSVWYTFPSMTHDELLLFSQYDRDASFTSDLWHCALVDQIDDTYPPRRSFDVRCFLLFNEITPSSRDRLRINRFRSILEMKGSAEFCAEQSRRRQE